jgi:integrase
MSALLSCLVTPFETPRSSPAEAQPTGALAVRVGPTGQPFYEATWRHEGRRMKRRIGPAWLTQTRDGRWERARGRAPAGHFDEKRATQAMRDVIADAHAALDEEAARAASVAARELTFRALAADWLEHVTRVERIKPSTLSDYRAMLAEPDSARRRGKGTRRGLMLSALGDLPAADVAALDVEHVLRTIEDDGRSPRTVNKYRATIRAIFNYGIRYHADRYGLARNPAADTAARREDGQSRLEVFTIEEIEALARTAAAGSWRARSDGQAGDRRRAPSTWRRTDATLVAEQLENEQLAETLRLAAYTGLRRGELVALRWSDVHWGQRVLVVQRSRSGSVETTTKGRRVRYVPLADQALAALDRISQRGDFTEPDDYVLCGPAGDRVDPTALRRRYIAARDTAGLPALRFHDLRHTAGTLLARHLDPMTVKDILGHADLKTTERYLHAVRASALSDAVTAAFTSTASDAGRTRGESDSSQPAPPAE